MTPEERLNTIADLIHECPPPDVLAGYDQCAHGTWPCQSTEAAWLAQGRDRDQALHRFSQAVQREAQIQDAERRPRRSTRPCNVKAGRRTGRPTSKPNLRRGADMTSVQCKNDPKCKCKYHQAIRETSRQVETEAEAG
jgi:hypothetical protein